MVNPLAGPERAALIWPPTEGNCAAEDDHQG